MARGRHRGVAFALVIIGVFGVLLVLIDRKGPPASKGEALITEIQSNWKTNNTIILNNTTTTTLKDTKKATESKEEDKGEILSTNKVPNPILVDKMQATILAGGTTKERQQEVLIKLRHVFLQLKLEVAQAESASQGSFLAENLLSQLARGSENAILLTNKQLKDRLEQQIRDQESFVERVKEQWIAIWEQVQRIQSGYNISSSSSSLLRNTNSPTQSSSNIHVLQPTQTVLILSPVKNINRYQIDHFWDLVRTLDYPKHLISFGFLESDSKNVSESMQYMRNTIDTIRRKGEYRRIEMLKLDFNYQLSPYV